MGQLCFTWSSGQDRAGGDVPCSKNSSGNGVEGKGRGLLRDLGGTPHPLPLPAGPPARKRATDSKHLDTWERKRGPSTAAPSPSPQTTPRNAAGPPVVPGQHTFSAPKHVSYLFWGLRQLVSVEVGFPA